MGGDGRDVRDRPRTEPTAKADVGSNGMLSGILIIEFSFVRGKLEPVSNQG